LGPGRKLRTTTLKGMTELVWLQNPNLVEASHSMSAKAGGTQMILMSAYKNRKLSATIEHASKGAHMLSSGEAVVIGGVPVDIELANDLVRKYEKHGLTPEVVEKAPRVQFQY